MRSAAQRAAILKGRSSALAKKTNTPKIDSAAFSGTTALCYAREQVKGLTKRLKHCQRNSSAKIHVRDVELKSCKAQLQETTEEYTASLQDHLAARELAQGSLARLGKLQEALSESQRTSAGLYLQLLCTQHALKMSESNLALAQASGIHQAVRLKELNMEVRLLRAKVLRVPTGPSAKLKQLLHVFKVKEKCEIVLALKVAVLRMVALGIGTNHVYKVLVISAKLFEVEIRGLLSSASICGVVQQGGVAAHLQVAEAMNRAASMTVSSNSTSIKSINYVAHHIMAISDNPEEKPRCFTLPITSIYSHSSQAQLDNWIALFKHLSDMLCNSMGAPLTVKFWTKFAHILQGGLTYHAPDQKCMITLLTSWKSVLDCKSRGCKALCNMDPEELLEALEKHLSQDSESLKPWSTPAKHDVV
jgi:hypothetical protein